MAKAFMLAIALFSGASALAAETSLLAGNRPFLDVAKMQQSAQAMRLSGALNWRVGDKASYKISSSVKDGSSEQYVREDAGADGYWVHVDVDMGFLGTQKMEMLFDKATGKIKKLTVNGGDQEPPNTDDLEALETRNERIQVAAGEFDAVYAKMRNRKDGNIQEGWTNTQAVPITGQIKAMGDSQIGKVTQELQAFSFAPKD